ncbi:hypothetical protein Moror_13304 [Moniliophthora roreri MCA 2997]|uniref:Uncharacterized protein n=1 Tax=Moniliophthora roreri (strain MCA 2997) TaxID=1381753 RepID=V2WWU8_MONRO|nr:hypothetical protein Moror_13304 [Moniliophthora roreri MCA 2997]
MTSSSSTAPQTNTPPTTLGKSSTSNVLFKSKLVLRRSLVIPPLFRSATQADCSLPPPSPLQTSPASPVASKHVTRLSLSLPPPSPCTSSPTSSPKRSSSNPLSGLRLRSSLLKPIPRLLFSGAGPSSTPIPIPSANAKTPVPAPPSAPTPQRPIYRPMKNESRCLQHITNGIYVAFEDDAKAFEGLKKAEELRADEGKRFTHIVQIIHSESTSAIKYATDRHKTKYLRISAKPHSHRRYESQMSVLSRDPELLNMVPEHAHLFLGAAHYSASSDYGLRDSEGLARLGPRQMAAAREFIRSSGIGLRSLPEWIAPRVLVTGPRDHRTDIISVVVCFLVATSSNCAAEVVDCINSRPEVKGVWQRCVSRQGAEYIQGVAWS